MDDAFCRTAQRIDDPVFDQCWWLYSVCRERLFADHTEAIASALADRLNTRPGMHLMEVGCGPGFYARRLAGRFPHVQVLGIDTSERLLLHARGRARREHLANCSFLRADARALPQSISGADAAVTSRLFLVLREPESVVGSIHAALRPGGVFFAAEPTSPLRTAVPLWAMRGWEMLRGRLRRASQPVCCHVMAHEHFRALMTAQPWGRVRIWRDKRYQYALCEKAS